MTTTSRSPRTLVHRDVVVGIAVLGLGLSACAGDLLAPPSSVPPGAPPSVAPDLPTSDDVLDLSPDYLAGIDEDIIRLDQDDIGVTLDEVRTIEQTATGATGDDHAIGLDFYDWEDDGNGAWVVWSVTEEQLSSTTLRTDLTTVLATESFEFADEDDDEAIDALRSRQVSLSDAAATALAARPGELMMAIPPDEPGPVLLVVVRQDDDTLVRVAIDATTGEAINAVEPVA